MRYLVWLVFVIAAVLSVLMGAARAVSHGSSASDTLSTLRLTECELPCWIGIVPGQTTLDEAASLLSEYFPVDTFVTLVNADPIGVHYEGPLGSFVAVISAEGNLVSKVVLITHDMPSLILADVVILNGQPACFDNYPARHSGAVYKSEIASASVFGNLRRGQRFLNVYSIRISANAAHNFDPCEPPPM